MATRNNSRAFTYTIDLDERGEFRAHVDNSRGVSVYHIDGGEIFEDGFMRHGTDIAGLEAYLKSLGLMRPADTLLAGSL